MSDLQTRDGLPEALRVLMAEYPRPIWEAHENFDGLTRFWLDRHLMFREVQRRLEDGARDALERAQEPTRFATEALRLGGFLLNQLHEHHNVEDHHYFPQLSPLDPRIAPGFDLLDRDHHALDPLIHDMAGRINAFVQDHDNRTKLGRLHEGFRAFGTVLHRHLTDEEDLVVPLILKYAPRLG